MQEWLGQNKEWLLSGVGVAAVSALAGVAFSIITFWINSRRTKKFEKKLTIEINLKQYQIRSEGKTVDLTVNYAGNTYEDLCEYSVTVSNSGLVAIKRQQLLFKFPFDCSIIKRFKEISSGSIGLGYEALNSIGTIEHLYEFDRLEPSDRVTLIYLCDTDKVSDLSCQPRGVDGVNYLYSRSESTSRSEFSDLWIYFSLFIFLGSIPFIGGMFQGTLVLLAGPTVFRLFRNFDTAGRISNSSPINLKEVSIKEGSSLDIQIKH